MRSIFVRVEPTVRLMREGEGGEDAGFLPSLLMFGRCIRTLPLLVAKHSVSWLGLGRRPAKLIASGFNNRDISMVA